MMKEHCQKCEAVGLTLLRVVVGVIMAVHGWEKLMDPASFIGHLEMGGFPAPQVAGYLAIAGEFLGGLGLAVGLLTPIAAFGVACVMGVAVFKIHWANGLLAQNQGFEYPLTLLASAIFFICRGAGPISLDALICRKKGSCGLKTDNLGS